MITPRIVSTVRGLAVCVPLAALAWWLAWALDYDFEMPPDAVASFWRTLPWILAIKAALAIALQGSHEWMRYVSFRDLVLLAQTLVAGSVCFYLGERAVGKFFDEPTLTPRVVILLDFGISLLLIGGVRSGWRFQREHFWPLLNIHLLRSEEYAPALLVGANRTGVVLANQIQFHPKLKFRIVGFLDDNPALAGTRFGGIPVVGTIAHAASAARKHHAVKVIVLDGSLPGEQLRHLMSEANAASVRLRVIANINDLLDNNPSARQNIALREVNIDDLLRRAPVKLDSAAVEDVVSDRVVMVTGAGGSIGSEICRQLLHFRPKAIVLLERAENALFQIDRELRAVCGPTTIIPCVADITDERRMRQAFETNRPEVLFHAAAHKHVPMMESNPSEALANNVFGTQMVARLADEFQLQAFVLISTDKAVRPTSVMGLSKQIAERYVQALAEHSTTRFVVVRFGNVLGSNGSVVPIFQEQIRRGGPVTITHRDMRRYFMTIPEASQLVLQASAMGRGGEIFVLEMGEPVKIIDLARDLIRLSGCNEADIAIVETGVRPGEKLYEELYGDDEPTLPTPHPKLRAARHRPTSLSEVNELFDELHVLMHERDPAVVHNRLRELFPGFVPHTAPPSSDSAFAHRG